MELVKSLQVREGKSPLLAESGSDDIPGQKRAPLTLAMWLRGSVGWRGGNSDTEPAQLQAQSTVPLPL